MIKRGIGMLLAVVLLYAPLPLRAAQTLTIDSTYGYAISEWEKDGGSGMSAAGCHGGAACRMFFRTAADGYGDGRGFGNRGSV